MNNPYSGEDFNKFECYELIETWLKTFKGKPGSNHICNLVDHLESMYAQRSRP